MIGRSGLTGPFGLTGARAVRTVLDPERLVTFIAYDEPALKDGEYTITAIQDTNQEAPGTHQQTRRFAVAGERFSIDPSQLNAVFPPDLATGQLDGDLPHVLLNRETLPWERVSVPGNAAAPWLAVLLLDESVAPTPVPRTAKELIPVGQPITVVGSSVTGVGTMPADTASYPHLDPLDYGQTPDEACTTIDLDLGTFSAVAPTAQDLPLLAHIRQTDTVEGVDTADQATSYAVVLGNRVPQPGTRAHAYLVSLENLGPLLPSDDGTPSPGWHGATTVRLLTYRWWTFTATDGAATFESLLEGLNAVPHGQDGILSSLQLPFLGTRPDAGQVQTAMNAQAAGSVTAADATILAHDAFALGYAPLTHHLRHGGRTVSWYRSPLAPLAVAATVTTPISCPDAVNRYNPQTGMFDVSYGSAWQLGLLLALQNRSIALALYGWRSALKTSAASRRVQESCQAVLDGAFESVFAERSVRLATTEPTPPEPVVAWLTGLSLLDGVPFNYLVPHEAMLPPESLRVFRLDEAWISALLDGALSLGRATSTDLALDAEHHDPLVRSARARRRLHRPNPVLHPDPDPASLTDDPQPTGPITGFLVRSAAVAGWPDAASSAWRDPERDDPLTLLRSVRLGQDVLLSLFDGPAAVFALHQPPGQLHCGAEGTAGSLTTTLREVTGATPGHQYDPPQGEAPISTRADGRTVRAATTAATLLAVLNSRFHQGMTTVTSAEFALEMVKGVTEVEFRARG
ncbi:MAG TPA: hypothetical protein VIT41_19515 [Microlunatus sp.]